MTTKQKRFTTYKSLSPVLTTQTTAVIALSVHSERQFVEGMLKAGASGYLLKDCAGQDLANAIRAVVGSQTYLSPQIASVVVKDYMRVMSNERLDLANALTNREREVLQLLAEGKTRKEAAEILFISPRTIEVHRRNIFKKLNLKSNSDLTKFAIREGLTSLGE